MAAGRAGRRAGRCRAWIDVMVAAGHACRDAAAGWFAGAGNSWAGVSGRFRARCRAARRGAVDGRFRAVIGGPAGGHAGAGRTAARGAGAVRPAICRTGASNPSNPSNPSAIRPVARRSGSSAGASRSGASRSDGGSPGGNGPAASRPRASRAAISAPAGRGAGAGPCSAAFKCTTASGAAIGSTATGSAALRPGNSGDRSIDANPREHSGSTPGRGPR